MQVPKEKMTYELVYGRMQPASCNGFNCCNSFQATSSTQAMAYHGLEQQKMTILKDQFFFSQYFNKVNTERKD